MAERLAGDSSSPPRKKQATLHAFFSGESSKSNQYPHSILESPQIVTGIHTYDTRSIDGSSGLQKDYKLFWNREVEILCNKAVRQKLKAKKEIESAINTKWTLHKE